MKKNLPVRLRLLVATLLLCCSAATTYASHIFAIDLLYNYVSGSTYKVTLVVYGDCSSATESSLPTSTPTIYVYEGTLLTQTLNLTVQAPTNGVLVSPVCPADVNSTTCNNINSAIPGIKKFVYTGNATINGNSTHWRFLFTGEMGNSSAGRSQSITSILNPGTSIIQLVDTLNNMNGPDSSATLTSLPTPFFCDNIPANYNPGAVSSDSLSFHLVPAVDASTGNNVIYTGAGISATNPITATPFSFSSGTGQLSFTPTALQKSLVVYNVEAYANGVLASTCQREMTFVVLNCNDEPPTGGIDSSSLDTNITTLFDSTDIGVCQSVGDFSFEVNPTSPTGNNVALSAAGLPAGATFTVTNDTTANPHGVFDWNTLNAVPGVYTFYLTFQDDACPLSSKQIEAITITLSPKPSATYAINSEPTCNSKGVFTVTPSGQGSPWVIKVVQNSDTLQTIPNVTGQITDSLSPGTYSIITTATTGAGRCDSIMYISLDTPHIPPPTVISAGQTTCLPNGSITVEDLTPGSTDVINYEFNGIPATTTQTASPGGTITIGGLATGTYNNLTVTTGNCISDTANTVIVAPPPPIIISGDSVINPTACGLYDGSIQLFGLTPGQEDVVNYNFNGAAAAPITVVSGPDGSVLLAGLTAGTYDNIVVLVNDSCPSNAVGPIILTAPGISANFTYNIHYGCVADTVVFTNTSQFNGTVYYQWKYGDGTIDTDANPTHIFLSQDSFQVRLYVTNLFCIDSTEHTIQLIHPIQPGFSLTADTICQGQSITFYNTSVGTMPVYFWDFGDGFGSLTDSPTHTFNIAGVYQVKLAENDFVPCFDTAVVTVYVDSTSAIDFAISDTNLCAGQAVTFTGNYSDIGNIGNIWTFGDSTTASNINPVQHAYDSAGQMTISLTTLYRKCRDTTIFKNITIKPFPVLNLGPDTSICPSMPPIALNDLINAGNPNAKWLWNTGDTASGILVATPGIYYTTVDINGCTTSDSVWVKNDCYINMPNAFTPNGDGVNDYFFPRQLLTSGAVTFSMNIYNRWGEQIFTTTSTDGRGWDGKFNSETQPAGVYIYMIDITFRNGTSQHYQGNVTLMR